MPVAAGRTGVREVDRHVAIVDIHTDVSDENEPELLDAFVQASGSNRSVIILNLSESRHVSSRCVELLVILLTHARRKKQRLLTYGATNQYQRMLDLTRLGEEVSVYQSESEALAAASSMIG